MREDWPSQAAARRRLDADLVGGADLWSGLMCFRPTFAGVVRQSGRWVSQWLRCCCWSGQSLVSLDGDRGGVGALAAGGDQFQSIEWYVVRRTLENSGAGQLQIREQAEAAGQGPGRHHGA